MANEIRTRNIHLDFHTSELIENIGVEFDPEQFAKTLDNACVNSVTLFTRGHHGNLYYDSKLFPEYVHPHLKQRDFLEQQTVACHRHGIDVTLYTTVCWDARMASEHPEWICINENGALDDFKGKKYFEAGFYKNLCMNTDYRKYCFDQFAEAMRTIPAEGVWFDAAFIVECCCPACQNKMRRIGLDPKDADDRKKFSLITYHEWVREAKELAMNINENFNITFNKGHVGTSEKEVRDCYTYYAIESLPGAEWGYMDFPISIKYNRNFGCDCLGMTGRFHTEWGDFSSFRNNEALEYECFVMIANGGKCIIGDQLEPKGKLNEYMYKRIGRVYSSVMKKEPWCKNSKPICEIGVFYPEEFCEAGVGKIPPSTEGVARLLQELSYQYNFIDSDSNIDKFKLVILPDLISINDHLKAKLSEFVKQGGKILATHKSGLDPEKNSFNFDLGVNYLGDAPYSPDFIKPSGFMQKDLYPTEYVMYKRGTLVDVTDSGEIISMGIKPVFNRDWEHFCSHLHSPSSGVEVYPTVVRTDHSIYFIHPLFAQFQDNAIPWARIMLRNAIEYLIPNQLVKHGGPLSLITNMTEQREKRRWILHLLHYIPERKCRTLDIIDTKIPLFKVPITMNIENKVKSVVCQPESLYLKFSQHDDVLDFTIPHVDGHQMVVITWE